MAPQKKPQSAKNRQTKLFISFDENSRREYLTGFRKRKMERKRKAKQNLEEKLKEERRQIRKEKRNMFRSMVDNYKVAPEIEHLVDPKVFDMDKHTVTVTDVSEIDITGQDGLRLGLNKGSIVNKHDEEILKNESKVETKNRQYNEEKLRHRINKANDLQQRIKAKQKKKHKPRDPSDPKSGSRKGRQEFGKKKKR